MPAAIPAITLGVSLAGAAYGAYSIYQAGQQSDAIAKYNAAKEQAEGQANLQAGAARSLAEREENQKVLAEQRAMFGAAGVVTNTGSPLTVETKTAGLLERKALNTDYEAAIASRFNQSKAFSDDMEGDAAKKASRTNAVSTLLGGVGNAGSAYYRLGPGKN